MNVFIAGGTSGIGLSLAVFYLSRGHRVGICGRDVSKIQLPSNCSRPIAYQLDVYDKSSLADALTDFAETESLDLMIVCAGHYYNEVVPAPDYNECVDMLRVNIVGTINAFEVAREVMRVNNRGHLVSIASVSGVLNYRNATIYSKTKRANIQICDAYRKALAPFGVMVTAVMPGYVDTQKLRDLNHNDVSKKMFLISANQATDIITSAIAMKKEEIVFPKKMKYLMYLLTSLPQWLLSLVMTKYKSNTCKK